MNSSNKSTKQLSWKRNTVRVHSVWFPNQFCNTPLPSDPDLQPADMM